ncbi:MAG: TonB-dependent receptor [Muribaculaceae bacterium]|nr:TonB-dependent receptor [Muribaculaceae bacterium]
MHIKNSNRLSWRLLVSGAVMVSALSVCFLPIEARAQSTSAGQTAGLIKGVVLDENNEPLIGATVMVKGTSNGTATDLDGNFEIKASIGQSLEVRYIGYDPKTVKITSADMTIQLKENNEVLDEVVVVGYGTQKKATMTGAVTAVGSEKMQEKGNLSSPVQALQGQVPGVIITRGSAAPGEEGWSMSLRGAVSKNSSEPLVIIDGVEYESVNELRLLNPSDIESINFLKDAAASIYGSKAAGGVVLVTTKKAKEAKLRVDYNGSVTGKRPGLKANLMTLDEWIGGLLQARPNDGYGDDDTWLRYALLAQQYRNQYIDLDNTPNPFGAQTFNDVADFVFFDNNWNDIMWGDAVSTSHELAISGGKEGATFRLSGGFMYDGSNLRWGKNNNKRYNLRLNNNFDLTKNLHLISVIAYNRQDQVQPSQIGEALKASVSQPGLPASTIDGKPYAWGTWETPNWVVEKGGENNLSVSAINISEQFVYNILPGFNANVTFGYNTSTASREVKIEPIDFYNYAGTKVVKTSPMQNESSYAKSSSRTNFYSVQGFLDYAHLWKDVHDFKVMGGVQYNFKSYDYFIAKTEDIQPELDVINGSGAVYLIDGNNKAAKWEEAIMSYYGRVNYNYDYRYLFEAQARYDGSSKFQAKNRWAFFWGVSAGWRIIEEKWMEGARSWLNELKLRASYGNVGNQSGIDRYSGAALYNFVQGGGALVGGELLSYLKTNGKLASADRTWERVHNYNIGIDFGFFTGRLTGTVEAFWKRTGNMLIDVTYPAILGDAAPTANYGKFKAWGYEGQINWNDRIGNVGYHVGATFTYAENRLLDNGGSGTIKAGVVSDREGYPLNSVFGLKYAGKIQNEEQLELYKDRYLDKYSMNGVLNLVRLGDNVFEDINNDGKLDENDLVYLGTDDPKIQFSFNAGVDYWGFDLNVTFQGAAKRTVWRSETGGGYDTWACPMRTPYQNSSNQWIGKVWSPENPNGYYPTLTSDGNINAYNYQCSSWSVNDGSYVRLKNITLGYTLPAHWLRKTILSSVRVYLTGTDIWEWTKIHDGWDPEAKRTVTAAARYPFVRSLTFGVNVSF